MSQTNIRGGQIADSSSGVSLTVDVTGTLPVANGGTGAVSLTGLVKGTGTTAMVAATPGTDYVTPTGVETLTNKTLSSPKLDGLYDSTNNKANLLLSSSSSAVNYLQIFATPAGSSPQLYASGSDTNIGIQFMQKGAGTMKINAATGQTPTLEATGADTNHDLKFLPKGTGVIQAAGNILADANITRALGSASNYWTTTYSVNVQASNFTLMDADFSAFVNLVGPAVASNTTCTLPDTTDTLVGKATTDTMTNKNLTSGTNTFPTFNQNTTGTAAGLSATLAVASGGTGATTAAGALTNLAIPADFVIVQSGATRATGSGDFTVGFYVGRAFTATKVVYQFETADASGSTTVELRRNGTQVTSSSVAVTAANQADSTGTDAARTVTISQSFAVGDRINLQITGIGTTPGKGLKAWIVGTWN